MSATSRPPHGVMFLIEADTAVATATAPRVEEEPVAPVADVSEVKVEAEEKVAERAVAPVKCVFCVQRVAALPHRLGVGIVFGEQKIRPAVGQKLKFAQPGMDNVDTALGSRQRRPLLGIAPSPVISKKQRRHQMQAGRIRSAIDYGDADQNTRWRSALAYSTKTSKYRFSIESPVSTSSNSGSDFRERRAIFFNDLRVREFGLRILVHRLHVGMRWCRIEIVVTLLDVFAMITLGL